MTACVRLDGWYVLAASPASVRHARRYVWEVLVGLGAAHVVADAELLVSELVTNAIRHVQGPPDGVVRVVLYQRGSSLRIEVHDADLRCPIIGRPAGDSESGRGLWVVAHVAAAWGWDHTATGKSVWAELPAVWAAAPGADVAADTVENATMRGPSGASAGSSGPAQVQGV
ncbi:MAG: ATP-binding protein [Carbonactinosporaceae bacterium]